MKRRACQVLAGFPVSRIRDTNHVSRPRPRPRPRLESLTHLQPFCPSSRLAIARRCLRPTSTRKRRKPQGAQGTQGREENHPSSLVPSRSLRPLRSLFIPSEPEFAHLRRALDEESRERERERQSVRWLGWLIASSFIVS